MAVVIAANRTRHPLDARTLARLAAQYADRGVVGFGLSNDERRGRTARLRAGLPDRRARPGCCWCRTAASCSAPTSPGLRRGAARRPARARRPGGRGPGRCSTASSQRGIALEVCPVSNVALGVYSDLTSVPLPELMAAGATIALGADDPLLFGSRLAGAVRHDAGRARAHRRAAGRPGPLLDPGLPRPRAGQAGLAGARSTPGWGQCPHERTIRESRRSRPTDRRAPAADAPATDRTGDRRAGQSDAELSPAGRLLGAAGRRARRAHARRPSCGQPTGPDHGVPAAARTASLRQPYGQPSSPASSRTASRQYGQPYGLPASGTGAAVPAYPPPPGYPPYGTFAPPRPEPPAVHDRRWCSASSAWSAASCSAGSRCSSRRSPGPWGATRSRRSRPRRVGSAARRRHAPAWSSASSARSCWSSRWSASLIVDRASRSPSATDERQLRY